MNIVNVFKIHYFLYWGSISGVLNYTILFITKHGEVNQNETGILYGMLPLTLMFAKPLFCSLADKYTIHEWVLVGTIICQTLSYGLIVVIPFIINKSVIWPMFCVLMLFGSISTGVLTSITDSLVMKVAEIEKSNFGKMRVWGTIGWGLISYGVGFMNEYESKWIPLYTPGILLFITLQLIDLGIIIYHLKSVKEACRKSNIGRVRRPTLQETIEQSITQSINQHAQNINQSVEQLDNSKEQLKEKMAEDEPKKKQIIKYVAKTCWRHPMLIKYILICIIVGMCTALNWNYFTLFLDQLRPKDTVLIGLTSVVQCFCSEMPFMYFSGHFIDKIGSNASFSIVLFTFALRYLLYTIFTSKTAYFILFVELTHGITFGLFYYAMNVLAREYSKKMYQVEFDHLIEQAFKRTQLSAEVGSTTIEEVRKAIQLVENDDSTFATMQGIMSGAYEGLGIALGIALGSLISGYLIHMKGFKALWYCVGFIALLVFVIDQLLMLIIFLRKRYCSKSEDAQIANED